MNRSETLADGLRRMVDGPAWHGPDLRSLLSDVSAADAAARPVADAHTIWELVLHAATWQEFPRRWLAGEAARPTEEENFPAVTDTSEEAWRDAVDALVDGARSLADRVAELPDEKLAAPLPGRDHDAAHVLRGVIEHHAYHAGQVALLRKALGLGRPRREETP